MNLLRLTRPLLLATFTITLAACGGGGDDEETSTPTPPPTGGGSGGGTGTTAAPLVISVATPSTLNGTLDKAAGLYESGSSNDVMGTFAATDDHCRVAGYVLRNSGDGVNYFIELSFRKTDRQVGLINFGLDSSLATLARVAAPTTGITVDTTNRRIVFTGFTLSSTNTTVTLDGSMEYPTNVAPENRAACG
jgi:hypothetical protein